MKETDLSALRSELAATEKPNKTLSVRKTIFALMPEILQKREDGMTLDDLVAWFAGKNIKTTRSALCNYISDFKKTEKPAAPAQRAPATKPKKAVVVQVPVPVSVAPPIENPFRKKDAGEGENEEKSSGAPNKGFIKPYKDL